LRGLLLLIAILLVLVAALLVALVALVTLVVALLIALVALVPTHEKSPDISIDENGKETLRNGRASDLPVPIGAQRTLRGQRLRGSVEVFAKTTQ